MASERPGSARVLQDSEIRIIKRVINGPDDSNIELARLTFDQAQDVLGESIKTGDDPVAEPPTLSGIFQSSTGLLELVQDGDHISGRYQFNSEAYVGEIEGLLVGNHVDFTFSQTHPSTQGCGRLRITNNGLKLTGYYIVDCEIQDLDDPELEDLRYTWKLRRVQNMDVAGSSPPEQG